MKKANHGAIDAAQLKSFIERIEKLNKDAVAIAADLKEIYTEVKSAGYDPKYVRALIKLRAKTSDEIFEEDELMQTYRNALGI